MRIIYLLVSLLISSHVLAYDRHYARLVLDFTYSGRSIGPFELTSPRLDHDLDICIMRECKRIRYIRSDLSQRSFFGKRMKQVIYFNVKPLLRKLQQIAPKSGGYNLNDLTQSNITLRLNSKANYGESTILFVPLIISSTKTSSLKTLSRQTKSISRSELDLDIEAKLSFHEIDGNDITQKYRDFIRKATRENNLELLDQLRRDYHIVFVTGMDGFFQVNIRGEDYFDSAMNWLESRGISHSRVIPLPTNSHHQNGKAIMRKLRRILERGSYRKKIILITYSRSVNEFSDALIHTETSNQVLEHIAGWVPVNASFFGNPLREEQYYYNPLIRKSFKTVLPDIVVDEMTALSRMNYVNRHLQKIKRFKELIPNYFSIGSRILPSRVPEGKKASYKSLIERGLENDGSSSPHSQVLPGSDYIILEGAEHDCLTRYSDEIGFNLFRSYLAIFKMVLEREGE